MAAPVCKPFRVDVKNVKVPPVALTYYLQMSRQVRPTTELWDGERVTDDLDSLYTTVCRVCQLVTNKELLSEHVLKRRCNMSLMRRILLSTRP